MAPAPAHEMAAHASPQARVGVPSTCAHSYRRRRLQCSRASTADTFAVLIVQVHRSARHDCRNRVLVDELRMTIASQQDTEIIEPAYNALQLYAVDEKDRQRGFVLANIIEKRVLQVLSAFTHFFLSAILVAIVSAVVWKLLSPRNAQTPRVR